MQKSILALVAVAALATTATADRQHKFRPHHRPSNSTRPFHPKHPHHHANSTRPVRPHRTGGVKPMRPQPRTGGVKPARPDVVALEEEEEEWKWVPTLPMDEAFQPTRAVFDESEQFNFIAPRSKVQDVSRRIANFVRKSVTKAQASLMEEEDEQSFVMQHNLKNKIATELQLHDLTPQEQAQIAELVAADLEEDIAESDEQWVWVVINGVLTVVQIITSLKH